ncbi:hypothetical protein QTQ03_06665 [Micromonospora sp. WMMA1363]|uniref:hypothetical protein n=1 Tax=Micromonospora sp. WMMA1363 TaxID=3053985 RepID=UPI00259CAA7C|nr:hypothetical protein [Micromonospora sp. WMMA1363]MDM4719295.1 hypothetical protein [Micromonospora sp. WMMA1363]
MPPRHQDDRFPVRGAVTAVRLAWGTALLLMPGQLLRPVGPVTTAAERTLRVLGARQVAQAAVTAYRPTPVVFTLGAVVDVLHAGTAVALAAVDRRQRSAALTDAVIATGWAVLSRWAARREDGCGWHRPVTRRG